VGDEGARFALGPRLGVEEVDVEDGFDAGEDLAEAALEGEGGFDAGGAEADGVVAMVAGQEDGAADVEIVRDQGVPFFSEDFGDADHGIQGAEAGSVRGDGVPGDAEIKEGDDHVLGFVVVTGVLGSADDDVADFPGLVETGGGLHPGAEVEIGTVRSDVLGGAEDDADGGGGEVLHGSMDVAAGFQDDPDVAGHDEEEEQGDAQPRQEEEAAQPTADELLSLHSA